MYWKGKAVEKLSTDIPVTVADIFPTIAKITDPKYRQNPAVDGQDLFHLIKDSATLKNRPLYWHYPHYSNQGGKPGGAIREGKWKLIYNYEDQSIELYDLLKDTGEQKDLASVQKETADMLKAKLLKWLKDTKASFPVKNMDYNAN
jgi:arylsulfatase A-like enzyme